MRRQVDEPPSHEHQETTMPRPTKPAARLRWVAQSKPRSSRGCQALFFKKTELPSAGCHRNDSALMVSILEAIQNNAIALILRAPNQPWAKELPKGIV
jgi:hypothetical protein